jgi:hypothetical protein
MCNSTALPVSTCLICFGSLTFISTWIAQRVQWLSCWVVNRSSVPARDRSSFSSPLCEDRPWGLPSLIYHCTVSDPGFESVQSVKLPSHHRPWPKLRLRGVIPSLLHTHFWNTSSYCGDKWSTGIIRTLASFVIYVLVNLDVRSL